MSATTTVIYEKGTDFKMDYYLKTHMPLVQEKWAEFGLKSWKVLKFPDDSPYTVQATLEWESMDSFKKAAGSPSLQAVMDDVKNFADKPPKLMTGELVGSQ
ncbi:hypothetical protein WHR41_03392 [Cladosporium halotolerans]|uniref:EthD domain-containing protein n=1 Tax=Cladosporium halotolerans TaxID=1052096 RepID=A0AB34KWW1_9PEZI